MLCLRRLATAVVSASLLAVPLFSQTFSSPKNYGPYIDSSGLVVGDFNRDGAADLLGTALINNGTQTQIFLYLNNGSGGFAAPVPIAGTVNGFATAVGDFNADGNLDFAFVASGGQVGVALGNGKGGFGTPTLYNVDGAPDSLVVGDFNDDGKPDIATLSNATKAVTVLTNTGTSFTSYNFTVPLYYSSNNAGYPPDNIGSLVTGDFNGNHRFDLAYLDNCADSNCGPGLARVYTLTNNGNNTFTANLVADQFSESDQLYAADVDLDGKVDLLVTEVNSASGVNDITVEYSNGNGSFTGVMANSTFGSSGFPVSLAVGDFNNDAIEDVADLTEIVSGSLDNENGFDVYLGQGGRSALNYSAHYADIANASERGGFAAAFFDQNGTRDVAMTDTSGLSVFLNTTSTSKDPCPYLTGTGLNVCLPAKSGTGPSPVQVLASYKAAVQPAQRIEVWADGKKLFQEYGDLLNNSVALSTGTHSISVVGVDATGKYVTTNETYTVMASCAAPSTAGVKICTPASGSTVSSPVQVSAAAKAASGLTLTALRLYVDNQSLYTQNGSALYTTVSLAKGTHKLVVVAYESNGQALTQGETITVK